MLPELSSLLVGGLSTVALALSPHVIMASAIGVDAVFGFGFATAAASVLAGVLMAKAAAGEYKEKGLARHASQLQTQLNVVKSMEQDINEIHLMLGHLLEVCPHICQAVGAMFHGLLALTTCGRTDCQCVG